MLELWFPIRDQKIADELHRLGFRARRKGLRWTGPKTSRSVLLSNRLKSTGAVRKMDTVVGKFRARRAKIAPG